MPIIALWPKQVLTHMYSNLRTLVGFGSSSVVEQQP